MELAYIRPKSDELGDVLSGDALGQVDVGNPKLVHESLIDGEVFPSGEGEYGGSHRFWF